MNTLIALIVGAATFYLGYSFYAKRIDEKIIKSDPKKATPAKMYMDGVDFSPASRNILYGYQFKSVAAAGPIVGAITAAGLWGWLPALLWLILGVTFVGWVQDYSAMMMAARRDGDSISAIAYKLVSPRSRTILLIFLFLYLLLISGAFGNLIAGALLNPTIPLGITMLALAGLLGGQMLYRWKMDIAIVTIVTVGLTLLIIALGPVEAVQGAVKGFNAGLDALNANRPIVSLFDPTAAAYAGGFIDIKVSYVFWLTFVAVFSYLGATLPVWRYAQPVNYVGFWIMALTILGGALGAAIAFFVKPELANFALPAFKVWDAGVKGTLQPLWPMLFVTIACGAISGWHALVSTVGTARQLENETDALPVGAGSMFSEMLLAVLALMAVSVAGKGVGAAAFAAGVGNFLSIFGLDPKYGSALALAAFVIIVITVMQLVIRFMRVALTEALGDAMPIMRNPHVGTITSLVCMFLVVLTGTFVYLWQLFGGANQLMASLALMLVTLWLVSERRNALYAALPMLFMYVTTIAANLVTAWNLWAGVVRPGLGKANYEVVVFGGLLMITIALLLVLLALFIGWDAWQSYSRMKSQQRAGAEAPA